MSISDLSKRNCITTYEQTRDSQACDQSCWRPLLTAGGLLTQIQTQRENTEPCMHVISPFIGTLLNICHRCNKFQATPCTPDVGSLGIDENISPGE